MIFHLVLKTESCRVVLAVTRNVKKSSLLGCNYVYSRLVRLCENVKLAGRLYVLTSNLGVAGVGGLKLFVKAAEDAVLYAGYAYAMMIKIEKMLTNGV